MNLLPLLENGLFALGQVMRFPIMLLLWGCVAFALFMTGRCLMDFLALKRERRNFDLDKWLLEGPSLEAGESRLQALPSALRGLMRDIEKARAEDTLGSGGLEHLVLEYEEQVRATLVGPRSLVKVGPAVGLIGTLIPMGGSLAAMAAGNLEGMAGQMVVAFTSTIIGLTTGTLAYVIATVRLGWVNQAVREQRYLAERVAGELDRDRAPSSEFVREVS